jgi:quinol monooxygenase YgiN
MQADPSAQLEAAEGRADELLATLSKAQAYAEKHEPGCLQYRISVDSKDKNKVCVFEVYVRPLSYDRKFHC